MYMWVIAALVGAAPSMQAQTAADLVRFADVLAHDSLRPRAVPSVELERTARYIAGEFERLGLRPGVLDESGAPSWFQRYPVAGRRWFDPTRSSVEIRTTRTAHTKSIVTEAGQTMQGEFRAGFATTAYVVGDTEPVPTQDFDGPRRTVLVAGRHTVASLRQADVGGANVVYVPSADDDSVRQAEIRQHLRTLCQGLLVLSPVDSATFATRVHAARQLPRRIADDYLWQQSTAGWTVEVWPGAFEAALAAAGVDLAEVRSATTAVVRPLPGLMMWLQPQDNEAQLDTATVPNVVGRLDGSDSAFQRKPLIISARIAHTGPPGGRVDTLAAAPDRDAAEVAALLSLAQAFSRSGARPRRPVIFLATSGGEPGSDDWGINYFITRFWGFMLLGSIDANLALEHLDRTDGDTLLVAGTGEVDLPHPLAWQLGAHPELALTLVEQEAVPCPLAGCWLKQSAFDRAGVPGLVIGLGSLVADARAAERAARILRFTYYLADDLANSLAAPRWNTKMHERLRTEP